MAWDECRASALFGLVSVVVIHRGADILDTGICLKIGCLFLDMRFVSLLLVENMLLESAGLVDGFRREEGMLLTH